jgi:hypothetical protein
MPIVLLLAIAYKFALILKCFKFMTMEVTQSTSYARIWSERNPGLPIFWLVMPLTVGHRNSI